MRLVATRVIHPPQEAFVILRIIDDNSLIASHAGADYAAAQRNPDFADAMRNPGDQLTGLLIHQPNTGTVRANQITCKIGIENNQLAEVILFADASRVLEDHFRDLLCPILPCCRALHYSSSIPGRLRGMPP